MIMIVFRQRKVRKKAYFFTIDLVIGLSIFFIGITLYYIGLSNTQVTTKSSPITAYSILDKMNKKVGILTATANSNPAYDVSYYLKSYVKSNYSYLKAGLSYGEELCYLFNQSQLHPSLLELDKNFTKFFIDIVIFGNETKVRIPYRVVISVLENGKNATLYGNPQEYEKKAQYITTADGFFSGEVNEENKVTIFGPCIIKSSIWN